MRNIHGTSSSAGADVRRALAQYHSTLQQVRELNNAEPEPDEPVEIQQGFERLAAATARAEQMARDALSNAVASFAGDVPCSVIVETRGGSSVVTLTGKPDGLIVAAAADRVPVKEIVCRPEPPPEFAHEFRQMAPNQGGVYLVLQGDDVVAIYNGVYFRSTNEVVADFLELIQAGFEGVWSDDYVVWCLGRIVAVIHQPMDGKEQKVFLFNEERNDPIGRSCDRTHAVLAHIRGMGRRAAEVISGKPNGIHDAIGHPSTTWSGKNAVAQLREKSSTSTFFLKWHRMSYNSLGSALNSTENEPREVQ